MIYSRDAQPFQDKGPKKKKEKELCRGPKQHVNVKTFINMKTLFFVVIHMNYIYYYFLFI